MTQQNDDTYLTAQEAMSFLGVSRNTLEKFVTQGRLKKYRQGIVRSVLFNQAELEALREDLQQIEPIDGDKK